MIARLGGFVRTAPLDLPGLTEPEAMRHYVRLSRLNYSIDSGLYPLGSCTMKHNPRLNEKTARLPGFADIHPLQHRLDGAGGAFGSQRTVRLVAEADQYDGRCLEPQGGCPW